MLKQPRNPPPPQDGGSTVPPATQASLPMTMRQGLPRSLPISALSASPKNCFNPLSDERYAELKCSIEHNGMVYPIIVRPKSCIQGYAINGEYEILSGHNRVRIHQELGMEEIKAQIVTVNDVEAMRFIVDTNIQRDEVTELEKAWAYREMFEAMNRQGHRSDLDEELPEDEQDSEEGEKELCDTVSQSSFSSVKPKKRTTEIIGEMYGVNGRTVNRKIRLTYLCDELYKLYAQRVIGQAAAADLSYLDISDQRRLPELQRKFRFAWQPENCAALRKDYNEWKRSGTETEYAPQRILRFMQTAAEQDEPMERKPRKYEIEDELFPQSVKKSERGEYVVKALRYVLDNGIEV